MEIIILKLIKIIELNLYLHLAMEININFFFEFKSISKLIKSPTSVPFVLVSVGNGKIRLMAED